MTRRAAPMPDFFCLSVVRAELRRADRVGQGPDRRYLRSETGLSRDGLERVISAARRQLRETESAAATDEPTAEGGAKEAPDRESPTKAEGPNPDPFASPTAKGKAKR